ncbi:uncharacterized protein LOC111874205 isoform X2 [Cryptotermes secundus]|uniref:uncharacterized protein LOC111874205 isoform X2 n=1 Tax=Cryptotermes secundus TaxID=105785 RepID=UPI000CD7BEF1|nr:uncharacterized protein LOC111874205 isoform X2 [Cryptotermes secundus]
MASEAVKKSDRAADTEAEKEAAGLEEESVDSLLGEPAHHARRPMNAFLIFCKRHRGVVRDRYPHLENRSITKILGEWWANLEQPEKASYTELARQYKEAFLKANPDFKWYKLPAPPLRTLITRPSNQNKPHKLECQVTCGPITPGKLADESQMGGLSSLLASPPTTPTTPTAPTSPTVPKPPKKRYLQEAMGLLEASTAVSPQQCKAPSEKEETRNGSGEGCTSSALDFRSSSSESPPMGLSSVNFMSPFTKLRSHAADQLNSLQERKTNRRRASVDSATSKSKDWRVGNMKEGCSKAKGIQSNLCFVSNLPSSVAVPKLKDAHGCSQRPAKLRARHHRSMSHDKSDSTCDSEVIAASSTVIRRCFSKNKEGDRLSDIKSHNDLERTIKASQQQIIDRVVDRLCGFTDHVRSPSPLSNKSAACINTFTVEKSPPLDTTNTHQPSSKQQRNVTSPPLHLVKNSVICSNNTVTQSTGNCKSPLVRSPKTSDACCTSSLSSGACISAAEGLACDFHSDASHEFDLKSINNNVYVYKDIASEMCKESRAGNCRPEGYYHSIGDYGTNNHASEVRSYGDTCIVPKAAETWDWKRDVWNESSVTASNCLLNSSRAVTSDICDKVTKTVNVIVNHTEPKPTFTDSDRTCPETPSVFNFSRTSKTEENNHNSVFQNENVSEVTCYSRHNHHDNRGVGFGPNMEVGLESMEENRLVFPALYGDDSKVRTILVHNPPGQSVLAKSEKYLDGQEGNNLDLTLRLSENRFFDHTIAKTLVNSNSLPEGKQQCTSSTFSNNISESCAAKCDSLPSNDRSESVVKDHNSRIDMPPKSGTENTLNGVPTVSSVANVKKFDPADYELKNSNIDIIRPKKLIHSSQKTASKLSIPHSLDHAVNGKDSKDTSGVNDITTPNGSEDRRITSQDPSYENDCVAARPGTLEYVADMAETGSEFTSVSTKDWTRLSEDEALSTADTPQLLPSPSEMQRRKSVRTCKGQRYREFMSEGRLALGKRTRRNFVNSNENSTDLPVTPVPKRERLDSESSSASEKTESSDALPELDLQVPRMVEPSPSGLRNKMPAVKRETKHGCRKTGKRFSGSTEDGPSQHSLSDKKSRKRLYASEESFSDSSPKKRFRAADFNLDEKIEALPSLSLEEFQLKKKARKKRNLSSGSPKKTVISSGPLATAATTRRRAVSLDMHSAALPAVLSPEDNHSMEQRVPSVVRAISPPVIVTSNAATTITITTAHLVGSQKRKARKQCITRLDPENVRTSRDTAVVEPDVLNNIGLTTLAEVAAAKKKLTK